MLQAEHELTIADLIARVNTQGGDIDQAALASFAINITPEMVTGSHALDTLDRALSTLDADSDYVTIDCPPFYGKRPTPACTPYRTSSSGVTEATSERAIELLMDQMAALERQTDATMNTLRRCRRHHHDIRRRRTRSQTRLQLSLGTSERVALQRAFAPASLSSQPRNRGHGGCLRRHRRRTRRAVRLYRHGGPHE